MATPLRSRFLPAGRLAWLARAALLVAAYLGLLGWADAGGTPAADKARPAETKKVDLPRLANEDLLKQADAIYTAASRDYLALLRALAAAEARLDEVRAEIKALRDAATPAGEPGADQGDGEAAAKRAADAARAKQDAARRRLKLVQAQKELLDRVTAALEACRSAGVAFQNALDDLKAYALEADLRVKDGSLAKDKLPDQLKADHLDKKKRELAHDLARLKAKAAEVRQGQEAIAGLLEQANKAALAADAAVVEEAGNLAREQQRRGLEKGFAGKKPEKLLAELARLVDEGAGLKGAYELALRKFGARDKEAARLRGRLGAVKPPDGKVPQVTRAEDVAAAAKAMQGVIDFHAARGKALEALAAALTALVGAGGEFEAEAAVSDEHLFKMQVLAKLLDKVGVPDGQLPEPARAARLGPAAARAKEAAAAVRAATEKAKAELGRLARQRDEAAAAREAAAKQLANLKESQVVTLAALRWEGRLRTMPGSSLAEVFTATRRELASRLDKLKGEAQAYAKAGAAAAEAKARLDGVNDPFLRAAEAQGQAEKQKILATLRKEAGLERATAAAAAPAAAAPAPPAVHPKKADPDGKAKPDTRTETEKAAERLSAFQQLLAGRVRVLDERAVKKKELLAALDVLAASAIAHAKTLADARLLALRLSATAVELKKRLGRGDVAPDALPDGITDALRLDLRTKLDATATSVLNALNQLQQTRDKLLRPDPDGEALAKATKGLLTVVGRRLDLLADLRHLAADYRRPKSAWSPTELKRLEQRAAERQDGESSAWDTLLGIDASKGGKALAELLAAYYRELIEIEDKEENLAKEREVVAKLLDLTRQETAALARLRPLLARRRARLEAAREQEAVLARARLNPDRAGDLLGAYKAKTGRLLPKPQPVADKDRAEKVRELANLLFERYVTLEAARAWDDVLAARAAPVGVPAEAGAYQDELSRLSAASAANARRAQALTGAEGPGPATGGEISQVRADLTRVRTRGVGWIALKIVAILLAALLLPRLLLALLGRARRGTPTLVRSALRAALKIAVWVIALILIFSTLGFDVTAIIAGLGIGGLAVGLAAQHMIADLIGAVVIFTERRFQIGDVIRLGGADPARVVGLTWRSTQVKNADGLVMAIPNRKVTEATIENLTRPGGTYDSLSVSVTTPHDAADVLDVIRGALAECGHLAAEHAVSVREFSRKGPTRTLKYRFSWFLPDYEARDRTRDEVFARISAGLDREDMEGTEVSLA
jgi:small-conductance mechanosensitive channel